MPASFLLIFLLSLVFLVLSADLTVRFAVKAAKTLRLSPLVVGATIVALGTSLPELAVTISSILQGNHEISLGNIVGSNIANLGLVLGLSIVLGTVRVGTQKTQRSNIFLIITAVLFVALQLMPFEIRRPLSPMLLVTSVIFILLEVVWGKEGSLKDDLLMLFSHHEKLIPADWLKLGGALVVLIISSKYLVASATDLARIFSVSDEIIGLSLVAVGTSLPELSISIFSAIKKEEKLLLGNILGSNILNLSLLGAIPSMMVNVSSPTHRLSLVTLVFITFFTFAILRIDKGRNIEKLFGIIFTLIYAVYIYAIYFIVD